MRTKHFLIFMSCVLTTTVFFIVFGSQQSESLQSIVSTTHQQLRNFQDNLRDAEQKNLIADEKYLKLLGFGDNPRLFPNATWHNTTLPAVVTYVREGEQSLAIGLVINVSRVLVNHTILVYDLGLSNSDLQTLLNYCNSSRCQAITYDLSSFPSHIDEDRAHAFRPLIIQDALSKTGAILFLENSQRFTRLMTAHTLRMLYRRALHGSGVLVWPMTNAVSSLTHPKMFDYFHTEADNFFFLPMANLDRLILINKPNIHDEIMLPWIQCALTVDCILPIGAQSGGCRFDKKPQYRYSGCHNYDVSALSIVLGVHHAFNETRYIVKEELFRKVTLETAVTDLSLLERNTTASTGESSSVIFSS